MVTLDGVYSRDGGNLPSLTENVSLRRSEEDELVDSKISVPYLLAAVNDMLSLAGQRPPTLAGLVTAGCGPTHLFWYRLSAATKAASWNPSMYNDIVSALGKFVLHSIENHSRFENTWKYESV